MAISAEKKLGHGTVFKQGATTIPQVKVIQPPGQDNDEVDVTSLDSTIQDFIPGEPPEVTEVTLEVIWVQGLTSQELLETACENRTNDTYSFTVTKWTTNRTGTFTAYCTRAVPGQIESKNPMTKAFRLRPTSGVTWS